jgi:hypothetical protein
MDTSARSKRWPKAVATLAVVGGVAFVIAGVMAFVPEASSESSIQFAGDNHPILSLPTTGSISHYRFLPRGLDFWAGRIDRARLQEWLAARPEPDRRRMGAYVEYFTRPWPENVAEHLPPNLAAEPFTIEGDKVRTWVTGYYELTINERTDGFLLMRAVDRD